MVNMITALCGYFSGTFVSDTGGTFKSDTPGTFVSDIGGTFEVILSFSFLLKNSLKFENKSKGNNILFTYFLLLDLLISSSNKSLH